MNTQQHAVGVHHQYDVVCRGEDGVIKWREEFSNLVVDTGLDQYLDSLTGSALSLFIGLTDGTPTIVGGNTMASHAGWVEVTAYDESARQALTLAAASGQSRTNSANVATFTISTNSTTVGGAFVTTDSTRGGTSGTLIAAGAFSSDKAADDGDTIEVTVTLTMAAA